ncbi:hypothetical protein [Rhodoferax sp.]|uniref:hypothetical protein n=1 Tax=Rhodoferax sp. TaxID=50421 RepID=UPI002ACE58FD|nr:hypothetical protein [Rhodoferax sp.]MDZ7919291.1 hypothetical protein [Rhodoferax sp.]
MPPESSTILFRSDLFQVDPREDEETNPFCYGRSLAEWVSSKFQEMGYEPEPVIAEDWGWCVMLRREPFMLWVGCGNDRSEFYSKVTPEENASFVPDGRAIEWSCFVGTDAPIWTPFFWKKLFGRASTVEQVRVVTDQLRAILAKEPRIRVSDETSV